MDFDFAYLFEISLTGIASGGLYALAALAFVMVYKATRVVNIAIGELLMVGAYLFFTFAATFALPLWLAIPAAVLGTGLLGALIERTMIRPLLGEPPIAVFMVTVGLGSVLVGLVEMIWTADQRRLPDFMPTQPIMVGEAFLAPKVFWGAMVALVFIVAVLLVFRFWRGGVALPATKPPLMPSASTCHACSRWRGWHRPCWPPSPESLWDQLAASLPAWACSAGRCWWW